MTNLTPSQREAIEFQGKNVLVSASAGSGKTVVMIERVLYQIRQGQSLSSFLISTFTIKAAAELRLRLEKSIKKDLQDSQTDFETRKYLAQALQDLPLADIFTMDAFANKIVKAHYQKINLDPNFRILSETAERNSLYQEVFEQLVETYLAQDDENFELKIPDEFFVPKQDFEKLVKNFSNDRNLTGFQEALQELYTFCQSVVKPSDWLKNNFLSALTRFDSFSKMPSELTESIKRDLLDFYGVVKYQLNNDGFSGKTKEKAQIVADAIEELLKALLEKNWSLFSEYYQSLWQDDLLSRWHYNEDQQDLKQQFAEIIGSKQKKGRLSDFANQIKFTEVIDSYQPDMISMAQSFQKVLRYYQELLMEQKNKNNAYEFSDIAHFAIEILESSEEIRQDYQAQYAELMIDEYQDTNRVQERLIELISRGNNVFMVGDIKQSIYGFRLAEPQLFLEKYQNYSEENDGNSSGKLIRLKENFRSREEIINFTNSFFSHLMDPEIGQMTYGKEEALVFGSHDADALALPATIDPRPELLLYEKEKNQNSDSLSNGEIELAAQEVIKLLNEKVAPKDIVLLVRTKSNNNAIEDVFKAHNIPVILDEGREDYLQSIEIQVMLDVLRTINNPLYDISLVACLHSPLFSFDEEELSIISLQGGSDTNYWDKVQKILVRQGEKQDFVSEELYTKLTDFTAKLTDWREMSGQIAIHELLWKIYMESAYYDTVGLLPGGDLRQANLQALTERAEKYEASGYKGLNKFIARIDTFIKQKNDLTSVTTKLPQNAVRVMTIHHAKGLQYDYVFLMNLQSAFSQKSLQKSVIADQENGISFRFTADMADYAGGFPHALVTMEPLSYLFNRRKVRYSELSEAMRVLYVAFTRAVKKLYMVGSLSKTSDYSNARLDKGILSNNCRDNFQGYQSWLLAMTELVNLPMKITSVNDEELQNASLEIEASTELADNYYQIIKTDYPYKVATELASLQTPSQIKKRYEARLAEDNPFVSSEEFTENKSFELVSFDKEKASSPTEIGSAVHSFMQNINFAQVSIDDLQETLDLMDFPEKLKKYINIPKIAGLFDTEFGKLMQEKSEKIRREVPFSYLKTDPKSHEQYVIRGIVDGFIALSDKILLFDYKTDRYQEPSELIKRYQMQMDIYAEALMSAYKLPVEKQLILLSGAEIKVVRL